MKMGWLIFMLLPLLACGYVLWHVYQILPLSAWWRWTVVVLMAASFLLLFIGFGRRLDEMPMPLATAVYEVGTSSLIILLYFFMLFLVLDLGRLCHLVPPTFLKSSWAGTAFVTGIMLVIFIYGNLHYQHKVRQPLTLTTTKNLTKPVRIVMMSDLHLGYHNRREELHRWVELVNAEKPDLILIAGDIIDRSLRPLEEQKMWEEFRLLKAPVVACLGNHEYYAGLPNSLSFYEKAGIRLLKDEVLLTGDLAIVGRFDRMNFKRKAVKALTANIDPKKYIILLDHQPYNLQDAEQSGVDFQLSGHTHHGQIWPVSWITESIYECAFGQHQRGNTNYYVSSGIGLWGGKFRIGTCSEYVVADITPATAP